MTDIALLETTQRQLESTAAKPPQALALIGPDGSGKTMAAYYLLSRILDLNYAKLASYPYGRVIAPEKNSISIDAIRDLAEFLKLKTIGDRAIQRFAIIEHADTMTAEAQNALLKTLEEPPTDSILILTVAHEHSLLPTVRSRLQTLNIHPPTQAQQREFFKLEDSQFDSLYRLSGGLPGLLSALANQEDESPVLAAVNSARRLLQQTTFERLAEVDALAKSKTEATTLLEVIVRMADAAIGQAANGGNPAILRRWQRILKASYHSQNLIEHGANAKLALTQLMLAM